MVEGASFLKIARLGRREGVEPVYPWDGFPAHPKEAMMIIKRLKATGGRYGFAQVKVAPAPAAAELGRSATRWRFPMHFLRSLSLALVAGALSSGALGSDERVEPLPDLLVGYTEFRTDLPGGRYVNVATRRAPVWTHERRNSG